MEASEAIDSFYRAGSLLLTLCTWVFAVLRNILVRNHTRHCGSNLETRAMSFALAVLKQVPDVSV